MTFCTEQPTLRSGLDVSSFDRYIGSSPAWDSRDWRIFFKGHGNEMKSIQFYLIQYYPCVTILYCVKSIRVKLYTIPVSLFSFSLFFPSFILFFIWAPSSEFVSSSIPSWQIVTVHAQPFRGARDVAFCLKVPLDSLLLAPGQGQTTPWGQNFYVVTGQLLQVSPIITVFSYKSIRAISTKFAWRGPYFVVASYIVPTTGLLN